MERQIAYWSDALYRGFETNNTPAEFRSALELQVRGLRQKERERYLIDNFGPGCLKVVGDSDRPLTGGELKRLWSYGHVEIGNHSWSHADLTTCSSSEIEEELELAQEYVEGVIGVRPKSMAFPYGLYNERVLEAVRRVGFTSGLSTANRRHRVSSLINQSFVLVGRFGSWNHKRAFGRYVLRLRCGPLFSDRVLRWAGRSRMESDMS